MKSSVRSCVHTAALHEREKYESPVWLLSPRDGWAYKKLYYVHVQRIIYTIDSTYSLLRIRTAVLLCMRNSIEFIYFGGGIYHSSERGQQHKITFKKRKRTPLRTRYLKNERGYAVASTTENTGYDDKLRWHRINGKHGSN